MDGRPQSALSARKRFVFNVSLAVLGLLIGVGVLEILLRLEFDVHRCDERLGWTFRPGAQAIKLGRGREFMQLIRFNSHGFRDRERSYEKPEGVFRIVVLGQSFSAGLQVAEEEVYTRLVEQKLAGSPDGLGIEVVNASTDGYSNAQQLIAFRDHIHRYDADVVLMTIFLGNDIADNWVDSGSWDHYIAGQCGRPYFELRNGALEPVDGGRPRHKPAASPVYGLLRSLRVYANFFREPIPEGGGPAFRLSAIYVPGRNDVVERAWQLTRRLILEARSSIESEGSRFAMLIFPHRYEVGQSPKRGATSRRSSLDYDTPRERLLSFLRTQEIDYLDLAPALRAHYEAGGADLYFQMDAHLNAKGHAVVAELLHDWLCGHRGALGMPGGPQCPGSVGRGS